MDQETPKVESFAEKWWNFLSIKNTWEEEFCTLFEEGEDYTDICTDPYDESLEIKSATNAWRLTLEQQKYLKESGFNKVYLNHLDGYETHYTFGDKSLPVRGWRRKYVSDPSTTTTRVISGDPDPGYFEISYWPEGWNSSGCLEWRETGYMRVIPDPLDPFENKTVN